MPSTIFAGPAARPASSWPSAHPAGAGRHRSAPARGSDRQSAGGQRRGAQSDTPTSARDRARSGRGLAAGRRSRAGRPPSRRQGPFRSAGRRGGWPIAPRSEPSWPGPAPASPPRATRLMAALPAALFVALVRGYQLVISPWLAPRCRFTPSCSTYALNALRQNPLPRALASIAWRLARCQPFAAGGIDLPPGDGRRSSPVSGLGRTSTIRAWGARG